jgi:hypothetical protein
MQTIERENRQNGNEKGSQESTCKEGREEDGKEEVIRDHQPNRQHSEGTLQSVPSVFVATEGAMGGARIGLKERQHDASPMDRRALG